MTLKSDEVAPERMATLEDVADRQLLRATLSFLLNQQQKKTTIKSQSLIIVRGTQLIVPCIGCIVVVHGYNCNTADMEIFVAKHPTQCARIQRVLYVIPL